MHLICWIRIILIHKANRFVDMLNILPTRQLIQHISRRCLVAEGQRIPDVHEPSYLDDLKPKVGFYELLSLQLKSYDFAVLEKYQSYIHRRMNKMSFNVINSCSVPCREIQVDLLTDRSTAIETSYNLKIYERNIIMKNALVTKLPILIDILHYTTPPGITFTIDRHTPADEDRLYFKDTVLEKLKVEFEELKETPLIGA